MNEFSGFSVENFDKANGDTIISEIPVGIQFGPMEKYYAYGASIQTRKDGDDDYIRVPKLALQLDGISYNGTRARGEFVERHFFDPDNNKIDSNVFTDLNPVPYDLSFSLSIKTLSLNHFTQILENILPFFTPERYLRVKEFSFLNVERNIKIRLDGVTQDFLYEQNDPDRRYINGTFTITAEAFLYKPFNPTNIIRTIGAQYITSPSDYEELLVTDSDILETYYSIGTATIGSTNGVK